MAIDIPTLLAASTTAIQAEFWDKFKSNPSVEDEIAIESFLEIAQAVAPAATSAGTAANSAFESRIAALEGLLIPKFVSITLLTDGTAKVGPYDPLNDTNWPGGTFIENTDWKHTIAPKNMTFDEDLGDFALDGYDGRILFIGSLYLARTVATTPDATIRLLVDGTEVVNAQHLVHNSVSPTERTIVAIFDATDGDSISLELTSGSGNIQILNGSSFAMMALPFSA